MAERWITCPKCKGLEVMLSDTGKFIPCQVCHGEGIILSELNENRDQSINEIAINKLGAESVVMF
ncbi:MAG: hypothetical protein ABFD50_06035 [Smithella sp.]